MKTDPHLLHIFRSFPDELYRMLGRPSPGPCNVQSVAVKQISRTADGVFMPLDPDEEIMVTEFQMWEDDVIYDRIVITAACIRMEYRPRKIRSVIVFGSESMDTHTEPWNKVVEVIYLDEAIKKISEQNPNHFLVALFRPLMESDEKVVEKHAAQDYTQLSQSNSLTSPTVVPLEAIFLDWLVQRFKTYSAHQITKMIAQLTPIEQTVAGKELIGIGLEQGKEIGMEKGKEIGMEKGKEIGMEKGKEIGMEIAAVKFLNRKFGQLSAELQQRVVALGGADLNDLLDAIFDQSSFAEFEAWLKAREGLIGLRANKD